MLHFSCFIKKNLLHRNFPLNLSKRKLLNSLTQIIPFLLISCEWLLIFAGGKKIRNQQLREVLGKKVYWNNKTLDNKSRLNAMFLVFCVRFVVSEKQGQQTLISCQQIKKTYQNHLINTIKLLVIVIIIKLDAWSRSSISKTKKCDKNQQFERMLRHMRRPTALERLKVWLTLQRRAM